jgi:hypothetical protein
MKRDYISKPRGIYPCGWAYDHAGSRDPPYRPPPSPANVCQIIFQCTHSLTHSLTHSPPSRLGWLIGQQQRLSTSACLRPSSPLYTSPDGVGAQSANAGGDMSNYRLMHMPSLDSCALKWQFKCSIYFRDIVLYPQSIKDNPVPFIKNS